jgi:hypothetical protein
LVRDCSVLRLVEDDSGKDNVAEKSWKHNAAISVTLCVQVTAVTLPIILPFCTELFNYLKSYHFAECPIVKEIVLRPNSYLLGTLGKLMLLKSASW